MTIDDWNKPEDTEKIKRYNFGRHLFRITYKNTRNNTVNLALNKTTISKILEKEPKHKPQLADRCNACGKATNHFIWINETTPAGETHKEKYGIHPRCHEGFLQAMEYITEKEPEQILLEEI